MSDRSLQSVQDTMRIPLYQEESMSRYTPKDYLYGQKFINLIPEFRIDKSNETKIQMLSKRPAISPENIPYMSGIVNTMTQCRVLDFIVISALTDVFVAAVFDDSVDKIFIIQLRTQTSADALKIGEITGASANDYCFLSEYSQSNSGSLYPSVAVNYTKYDKTSSKGYYARSSGGKFAAGVLTEITDTSFPPKQTPALVTIGRFIPMNGTMYIATDDGQIWNSYAGQNDITAWTNATGQQGFIRANAYPDRLIGLMRYKHHIVAFGQNSIEFYNDVGDIPCPLARTDQAFIKFGGFSPRQIRNVGDVLYWVAYGDGGTTGLWRLDGYTPVKVSSPFIDGLIFQAVNTIAGADPSTIHMQVTVMRGKTQILLNGIATQTIPYLYSSGYPNNPNGETFDTYTFSSTDFYSNIAAFNVDDGLWWHLGLHHTDITIFCATGYPASITSALFRPILLLSHPNNSSLNSGQNDMYYWLDTVPSKDTFLDATSSYYPGVPITSVAQTNPLWFGNEKRKRINKLKIIGYNDPQFTAIDSGAYSRYVWFMKDAMPFTTIDSNNLFYKGYRLSTAAHRDYLNNFGMARVWTFIIAEKSSMLSRYEALELDIQQGSH